MTPNDFRKLALSLLEAAEQSHMDHPDFRVGGKIFATLGYPSDEFGCLSLAPPQQAEFVTEEPEAFQPVKGKWGERGATQVQLKKAKKKSVKVALVAAWRNIAPKRLVREFDGEDSERMEFLMPVIVVGVIVLIAGIIYGAHVADKKRTEALQKAANELGFEFQALGDAAFLESLKSFHLFSQGHSKKLLNLLRGTAQDLEVSIFDYRYVTGSGKHSHTWNQTVIAFRFDGAPLPTFSLRPENIGHRISSWFGYQDINFDTHRNFSRKYLLRGSDETTIRALFTANVLDFYDNKAGLSTEGSGNSLLFYRHAKKVKPEAIRSFMEEGFGVLTLFRTS